MAEGSWSHQIERKTLEKAYERIDALEARVDLTESAISGWYRTANLREAPLTAPDIVAPDEMEALRARVAELESQNGHLQAIIEDQDEQIDFLKE